MTAAGSQSGVGANLEIHDPAAQGQQTGAENQGPDQIDPVAQVREGMQKRIDELVAKNHERDAQIQAMMTQQAQLLATLSARQEPVDPGPQVPEGMDPQMAAYFETMLSKVQAPLMKQIEQLKTQIIPPAVQGQMGQVQQQLQQVNNPAVTARVSELVRAYEQKGWLQNGTATPMDAFKIAMGEAAMGELGERNAAAQQRQAFNSGGGMPLTQGRNQTGQFTGQPKQLALDAVSNVTDLTQDQLRKVIDEVEKNFPDGIPL